MEICSLSTLQPNTVPESAVILLGCFDGVHLGHLSLLKEAVRLADGCHPVVVWVIGRNIGECLTTWEEKCRLFLENGAHVVLTEEFEAIRSLTGEAFFQEHLLSYHPHAVVCGFNFRFGVKASCNAEDLRTMAENHGIQCSVMPPMTMDGEIVSSTAIRNAIRTGDLPSASRLLGRDFTCTSEIVRGKQLGRTISHPTLNQRIPANKIVPPYGVYSCTVTFEQNGTTVTKGGVCNIGSRPTVNEDREDVTLETYLFDFSGDLYGVTVTTSLVEMLREERRFESLDRLRQQIEKDEEAAHISLRNRRADL